MIRQLGPRDTARWTGIPKAGHHHRANAGYTLIEILVVLAIIGLVMGLAGPRVLGYLGESKIKAAKLQVENISSALDLYFIDIGKYPSGNEGLTALLRAPAGASTWNGPYLKGNAVPLDPWGRPYIYRSPVQNGAYELSSLGPDGREGSINAIQKVADQPR